MYPVLGQSDTKMECHTRATCVTTYVITQIIFDIPQRRKAARVNQYARSQTDHAQDCMQLPCYQVTLVLLRRNTILYTNRDVQN